MQQIERGIFYEDTYLGVTLGGVVCSHGTVLIDAPLRAEDARAWRSSLLNQRGGANRILVNLDSHPDRTLGARALDCTIVAHAKTALVFRGRPTIFKGQTIESGGDWEVYEDAIGMRWAIPDIIFNQRMSLHWGGPEILLESHPGPTPGSIWVVIHQAKVAFVGDSVMIDQPPYLAQADLEGWIESLHLLQKTYQGYTLISGRGGPAPAESVHKLQHVLKSALKGIDRLGKQNAPPDATEELVPGLLAEYPAGRDLKEKYVQRLRYGLYHCYIYRFQPSSDLESSAPEPEEA